MKNLFLCVSMLLCVTDASAAHQKKLEQEEAFQRQTSTQKEFYATFMESWREFMLSWDKKHPNWIKNPAVDPISQRMYAQLVRHYADRVKCTLQVASLKQEECALANAYYGKTNTSTEEEIKFVRRVVEINDQLAYLQQRIEAIEKELK